MINIIKRSHLILVLAIFFFITVSCVDDPMDEKKQELIVSPSLQPVDGPIPRLPQDDDKYNTIDTTALRTIYIEWHPHTLIPLRDQIRDGFSDVNGEVYLYDFNICDINTNVEEWRVILKSVDPKDQTPPPLIILMDTDDEMKSADYHNNYFSFQCNF